MPRIQNNSDHFATTDEPPSEAMNEANIRRRFGSSSIPEDKKPQSETALQSPQSSTTAETIPRSYEAKDKQQEQRIKELEQYNKTLMEMLLRKPPAENADQLVDLWDRTGDLEKRNGDLKKRNGDLEKLNKALRAILVSRPPPKDSEATNGDKPPDPILDRLNRQMKKHVTEHLIVKAYRRNNLSAEIAKSRASLEQIRRCYQNPYPGYANSDVNVRAGDGGPLVETETGFALPAYPPGQEPPHGAYMEHYQRWLVPETSREPVVTSLQSALRTSRQTRNSQGQVVPAEENSAMASTQPQGHPLVLQNSTGEWVKLSCPCKNRGHNAKSIQGFINHCRILHRRHGENPEWIFKNHKDAADKCGDAGAVEPGDIHLPQEKNDTRRRPRNIVPPAPYSFYDDTVLINDPSTIGNEQQRPVEGLTANRRSTRANTSLTSPIIPRKNTSRRRLKSGVHPLNTPAYSLEDLRRQGMEAAERFGVPAERRESGPLTYAGPSNPTIGQSLLANTTNPAAPYLAQRFVNSKPNLSLDLDALIAECQRPVELTPSLPSEFEDEDGDDNEETEAAQEERRGDLASRRPAGTSTAKMPANSRRPARASKRLTTGARERATTTIAGSSRIRRRRLTSHATDGGAQKSSEAPSLTDNCETDDEESDGYEAAKDASEDVEMQEVKSEGDGGGHG